MEIEIKLKLPARLDVIRRRLRAAGFRISKSRNLEFNTLFDDANVSLRKQGKVIRIRHVGKETILTYKGPGVPGPHKSREEIETELSSAKIFQQILEQIGFRAVFRYEKFRTEFERPHEAGKIMLDETPIGKFLEIEGSPRWIDRTASDLVFTPEHYITSSYGALYLEYCREHGIRPTNMLFKNRTRR